MKKQRFKVERSTEGNIFELAFVLLTIVVWGAIVMLYNQAPDIIPTHFGPSGAPDAFGPKTRMFFPCIIVTVVAVCMMAGAYFPHSVNLPGVYLVNERHPVCAINRSCCLGHDAWACLVCADNDCHSGAGLSSLHIFHL